MRRWAAPLVLAAIFSTTALAQPAPTQAASAQAEKDSQPSESQLAAARELIRVTNIEAVLRGSVNSQAFAIKDQIKKALPRVDEATGQLLEDIAKDEFTKNIDGILDRTTKIYATRFSETDLHTLIAFYETEAGKRYVAQVPVIMQDMAKLTSNIQVNILQRFQAEMLKRNAAKEHVQ